MVGETLLVQLLERLRESCALAELAALLGRGIELLGRNRLVARHAELRAQRTGLLDRRLDPVLAGHHLPFLMGTPRFLSKALSRAEPSLMPRARSEALSLASVHFPPLGRVTGFATEILYNGHA